MWYSKLDCFPSMEYFLSPQYSCRVHFDHFRRGRLIYTKQRCHKCLCINLSHNCNWHSLFLHYLPNRRGENLLHEMACQITFLDNFLSVSLLLIRRMALYFWQTYLLQLATWEITTIMWRKKQVVYAQNPFLLCLLGTFMVRKRPINQKIC